MAATAVVKARFSFRFSSQSLQSKKKNSPASSRSLGAAGKRLTNPNTKTKRKKEKIIYTKHPSSWRLFSILSKKASESDFAG